MLDPDLFPASRDSPHHSSVTVVIDYSTDLQMERPDGSYFGWLCALCDDLEC